MRSPSPNANLAELLAQWSTWYGWNDRAVFLADDDFYTHGEVHAGGARVASLLRARGVRPGDRVLITLDDSIEFAWSFLGTVRLGAVAVLAGPGLAATEYALVAHEMAPVVTVCAEQEAWRFADPVTPQELAHDMIGAPILAAHPVAGGATAFVHYTPTGKTATRCHRDPENRYVAIGVDILRLCEDATLLSTISTHASLGLENTVFFPLFSGAAAVLSESKTVQGIEAAARHHRPTVLFAAPSFFGGLLAGADRSAFGSLRAAVCEPGSLPPVPAAEVATWLGCPLLTPDGPRDHVATPATGCVSAG